MRTVRSRAGFTLVELMAAMVISAILALVIFQLIQGQGQFVALQSAREEVQQNARGALEIMASELRSAAPGGIITARDTTIEFALPRAWGIVCSGSSGTVDALFPDLPADMFATGSASGLAADTGAASRKWAPKPALTGSASVDGAEELSTLPDECEDLDPDGDTYVAYRLTGSGFPSSVPAGNLVYLYQLVKYNVAKSDDDERWWVYRSNGVASGKFSQQPLAGPIPHADSLRFTYFTGAAATRETTAPGTDAAKLATISRIGVRLTTSSRRSFAGNPQYQSDSTTVHLRNQ